MVGRVRHDDDAVPATRFLATCPHARTAVGVDRVRADRGRGGDAAGARLPWAGAAAIFASIPWSPSWVLGLPFGIWAIIILGKPQVTEAFLGDKRQAESGPAHEWFPRIGIASRFLSMFRSCVGYVLPTMPGRNTTTGDWSGESPQPNVNLVPRPGASDSGEGP